MSEVMLNNNSIPFFLFRGATDSDVIVVCDPLTPDPKQSGPLPYSVFELLLRVLRDSSVDYSNFLFVPGSQPGPNFNDFKTESQRKEAIAPYGETLRKFIAVTKPKLVIALGPLAGYIATGKKYSMKEYRGHVLEDVEIAENFKTSFFLTRGIETVYSHPKHYPTMKNDFSFLKRYIDADFSLASLQQKIEHPFNLFWSTDIEFLLDKTDLRYIAVDAETQGLHWYRRENKLLTVQIAYDDNSAVVVPVSREYWPEMSLEELKKLRKQLKHLLSNPKIQKTGHNLVFDYMWFKRDGLEPKGFRFDSQQLAHAVNENNPLNLRDCIKIYQPELAGYSDIFDRTVNKSNMMAVPRDQMLVYGGGDAVASYRLTKTLVNIIKKDKPLFDCVMKLKLPCLFGLADSIATNGIQVDIDKLREVAIKFAKEYDDKEEELLKQVPKSIKQRAVIKGTTNDPLSLSRDEILRSFLFTKEGLNLTPIKFTASGDPSLSIKEHLPYFDNAFTEEYIDFSKLGKFLTTYIGNEEDKTGFWQYFAEDLKIYPSYSLSMTDTGRTSCFTGGTLVEVLDSRVRVPIKDIKAGDWVLSTDENLKPAPAQVTWSGQTKKVNTLVKVTYSKSGGQGTGEFTCTPEHPIRLRNGQYIAASALVAGDRVLAITRTVNDQGYISMSDLNHLITNVEYIETEAEPVYDITVPKYSNFYANGVNVHNSRDPNGQNIPQHGDMAKEYKAIFIPEGIKTEEPLHFFEADYSQAELRIMAIESQDPVMLDIYNQGLDMHKSTAALVLGVSLEEYLKLPKDIAKPARQQAKAINFGLLYEMWYKKLPHYAKITYKLDMTEEQAKEFDTKFFNLYRGIKPRNTRRKEEAKRHGYVRYMHGYCRHLPDINSPDNRIRREAERQAVNCVDEKTQLLAKDGWKSYSQLKKGDLIYTKNPNTGELELQPIQKMNVHEVDDCLVSIEDKKFSSLTTKNHRWLVSNKATNDVRFKLTEELSDYGDTRIHLVADKPYSGNQEGFTSDFIQLCGWFLTDGYICSSKKCNIKKVGISQSNRTDPEKVILIRQVLDNLGVRYKEKERMPGRVHFEFSCEYASMLCDLFPNRTLTPDFLSALPSDNLQELYDTMLLGDGCFDRQAGKYRKFCCGTKAKADMFSMLCTLLGKPHSVTIRNLNKYKRKVSKNISNVVETKKTVYLVELKERRTFQTLKKHKGLVEYRGVVWCPTVENGTFVARRNESVYITGNSPIQGFASDLGVLALTLMHQDMKRSQVDWMTLNMYVHDSIKGVTLERRAREACSILRYYMENLPLERLFGLKLPIPLLSDVGHGPNMAGIVELEGADAVEPYRPSWCTL